MPEFKVKLIGRNGRVTHRRMQAVSEAGLRDSIRAQGIWLIGQPLALNVTQSTFKLRLKDEVMQSIMEQLVLMLDSGVGIQPAIERLGEQYPPGKTRFFLTQVAARVGVDGDLAAAFGQFPNVFAPEMISMIRPAQGSATLIPLLTRLAEQIERRATISATVKKGTAYPAFVGAAALLVVMAAMFGLVPRLQSMLTELGVPDSKVPSLTRMLFTVAAVVRHYLWVMALACIGAYFLTKRLLKVPKVRLVYERVIWATPKLGVACQAIVFARMFGNVSMLYGAGLPLEQVLDSVALSVRWLSFRQAVIDALAHLKKGKQLSDALGLTHRFPPMVIAMVATGESTGTLDRIFDRLSAFYAKEAERAVSLALTMLEPVMICLVGFFVGWIVFSIYQPISTIYDNVK